MDHLNEDMVLHPVNSRFLLALRSDGRPDFGQTVVIEGVDSQASFNLSRVAGLPFPLLPEASALQGDGSRRDSLWASLSAICRA